MTSSPNIFDDFDDLLDTVDVQEITAKVLAIQPKIEPQIPCKVIIERLPPSRIICADDRNLVKPEARERFVNECIFEENDIFTAPINTTDTMEGYLSGVSFDERQAKNFTADNHIVAVRSNYVVVIFPGYEEPRTPKASNRGRKKQEKKRKVHKMQGTGEEFNSQISFHVRAYTPEDPQFDPNRKPYKVKVFRTGRLQLPGAKQTTLGDVFSCLDMILDKLHFTLGGNRPKLESLSVVMKNYKFTTKMPPGYLVNLSALKTILLAEQMSNSTRSTPPIFMVKFNFEDSKLSVLFSTPNIRKAHKMVRVKIFMKGKVNILGAIDDRTSQICDYLYGVFGRNQSLLFVAEGGALDTDNIAAPISPCDLIMQHRALADKQMHDRMSAIFKTCLRTVPTS